MKGCEIWRQTMGRRLWRMLFARHGSEISGKRAGSMGDVDAFFLHEQEMTVAGTVE